MWAFTYVSESGTRMSIGRYGLNTIYTNLDTKKVVHVRIEMSRLSARKLQATRYINNVAQPTTLFYIDARCGMRPHYGLNFVSNKWDALGRVNNYSDTIVMALFEEAA